MIAESFERIHRSNLIGMGILPLEFPQGVTRKNVRLIGEEKIDIVDLQSLQPGATVPVTFTRADGSEGSRTLPLSYRHRDGVDLLPERRHFALCHS